MFKKIFFDKDFIMRNNLTVNEIKEQIDALKGKDVEMIVNKGRKKTEKLAGRIQNLYPSVFTVNIKDEKGSFLATYSYTEVLCGFVKFL